MSNSYFKFKQFTIHQDRCAMKVTTDGCLFGAFVSKQLPAPGSGLPAGKSPKSRDPIAIGFGVRSTDQNVIRILDIGTGTGLLALMVAQKTNAVIDAIEIDRDAFEQAKENVEASPWNERINIYHGDAREFSCPGKYDIIISNPPFYENELKSPDEKKNIAHHGGLALNELFQIVFEKLLPNGHFFLLLPEKRAVEASLLLSKYHLEITNAVMVRQSTQHDYFRVFIQGQHAGNENALYSKTEMAIWDDAKEYTEEFIELLKDYYLYL